MGVIIIYAVQLGLRGYSIIRITVRLKVMPVTRTIQWVRLDAWDTNRLLKGRCKSPRRLEAPLEIPVQTRRLQWRVQALVQGLGLWGMGLNVTPEIRAKARD